MRNEALLTKHAGFVREKKVHTGGLNEQLGRMWPFRSEPASEREELQVLFSFWQCGTRVFVVARFLVYDSNLITAALALFSLRTSKC